MHVISVLRRGRNAWRAVRRRVYSAYARRRLGAISRGTRDCCWCGGSLSPFPLHDGFGVCTECGTYVNRRPPASEELPKLYSMGLYWHVRQRMLGHPAIEQRPSNDRRDGRVDYWLELIRRYGPACGDVLEVGCGSGVLLAELAKRGYRCVGVEPDPRTAAWVQATTGVDVRPGFFPGAEVPEENDLFLAFDVIEHAEDPYAFLAEAAGCLRSGGVAVLQTPIDRGRCGSPFGDHFHAVFNELEHLFILTDRAAAMLAERAGLTLLSSTEAWRVGHEVLVLRKP